MRQLEWDFTMRVYCAFDLAWKFCCKQCRIRIIYDGEWYIKRLFYLKSHEEIASQSFVCPKLFTGRSRPFGIPVM